MPNTPNRATLTASIIAASSAPLNDGYQLVINPDLSNIEGIDAPLPVQLDHNPTLGSGTIGQAYQFAYEVGDGVDLLTAVIQLQESPEVEKLWPFIESGAAKWSIRFEPLEVAQGDTPTQVVTRWRALEISAVAMAADSKAVTRKAKLERDIRILVSRAKGLPEGFADELVSTCTNLDQVRTAVLDKLADMEPPTMTQISPFSQPRNLVAEAVDRAWSGQASTPLWLELRELGHRGRNPLEVMRYAMSTSDLPVALLGAGERALAAQFAAAPQGVRLAASIRPLSDYRQAVTLDAGLVGKAQKINEGGEIKFNSIDEIAATYKPSRFGLALTVTPEALANDNLGALDQGIQGMGAACLQAEAEALAALLQGAANGATTPDGKALFHADHANTVAGPLSIQSIGQAVAKLRTQSALGGRLINQTPGAILCSPGLELTVRQLLSATITPNQPEAVNPWAGLAIEVDPLLSDTYVYLLASGPRRPLELGRVTEAPQILSEVHFETGAFRVKAEHAFGVVTVDHRPIVRLSVAA